MPTDAIDNAKAHLETIAEIMRSLGVARACDNGDCEHEEHTTEQSEIIEKLEREIDEYPLSVLVRSGWYVPGTDDGECSAAEYEILLSTGGPALRIVGDLDNYGQPEGEPRLEWQDWGTPWTEHRTTREERDALAAFAGHFWYGEGA
jgi:hypothetical protein